MWRSFLSVGLLCRIASAVFGQGGIEAYVETKTFQDPDAGPFVVIGIAVVGSSVVHQANAHGFHQALIHSTVIAERNGAVADYRKAEILGPERTDTARTDFVHQEILPLAPGDYDLEILLRDGHGRDTTAARFFGPLSVPGRADQPTFSDVLFTESVKTPQDQAPLSIRSVTPFVSTYFSSDRKALGFYCELYGTDQRMGADSLFLLTYQIEDFESKQVHGAFRKVTRAHARPVIPILAEFDIATLPSGNYVLSLEARDRSGELMARKEQFFQRNNPVSFDPHEIASINVSGTFADAFNNPDTLAENIRSLRPIATDLERKMIDDRGKDRDLDLMKRFFLSFWFNRDGYDPQAAWERYHKEVIKVNHVYGCRIKKGYETDRGYVHLKYGAPNTVMDQPFDNDGYPYQIWHYYRVGKYSNKRFVFYLPDKVTGCYELLHAEIPGEMKNENWNQLLHARNVPMNNVQDNGVPIGHGQQVQDFYDLPH